MAHSGVVYELTTQKNKENNKNFPIICQKMKEIIKFIVSENFYSLYFYPRGSLGASVALFQHLISKNQNVILRQEPLDSWHEPLKSPQKQRKVFKGR